MGRTEEVVPIVVGLVATEMGRDRVPGWGVGEGGQTQVVEGLVMMLGAQSVVIGGWCPTLTLPEVWGSGQRAVGGMVGIEMPGELHSLC